ncbi:MAG: outer membrane beta-barrel protein [Gemmatimonadaceae bacterium]|nr:outer membrane beta-barrel protein [Gemmatimonadaceae bacterium]
MYRRIAIAAAAMCATAAPALAQQRQAPLFTVEGGATYQALRGSVFGDLNDGRGAEAQVTMGISNLSVSGGYQRSWHRVTGTESDATLSGFYIEPRLALPFAASNFTPYLYGRGGVLERAETVAGTEVTSNVTQMGGGIGSLIYLAKGMQLNIGGGYQFLRAGRRISDDTRASGGSFVLRAGLSLGGNSGWARDPGY